MKLLDTLTVHSRHAAHTIELFHGDLGAMPPDQAVDVLVVSAFPGNYLPTRHTLIGALYDKGVSVAELSHTKAADLRESFSCWLSGDIPAAPGIQFNRILCFEPLARGQATEIVGDIFRSLIPFVHGEPHITRIAMPVVATGSQRVPITDMLEGLLDAAVNWLRLGLPVTTIKIVEYTELKAAELKGAFAVLKKRYAESAAAPQSHPFTYDLFISYSHQNTSDVRVLFEELKRQRPDVRIFLDRNDLDTGAAWQQTLYEALDDCRKVLTVYSPPYITSKVCKEEFNIAMLRHRDAQDGVLIPVYLYSASLPSYMRLIQFIDCREGDHQRLRQACASILEQL